jgi:hypothetical protein
MAPTFPLFSDILGRLFCPHFGLCNLDIAEDVRPKDQDKILAQIRHKLKHESSLQGEVFVCLNKTANGNNK